MSSFLTYHMHCPYRPGVAGGAGGAVGVWSNWAAIYHLPVPVKHPRLDQIQGLVNR